MSKCNLGTDCTGLLPSFTHLIYCIHPIRYTAKKLKEEEKKKQEEKKKKEEEAGE